MAREMKDSGVAWIGEIPEKWNLYRIKSCITDRTSGAWGNDAKNSEGDIVCLRIADFDYDKFRFKDTPIEELTIRNYDTSTIEKLLLNNGDILVEKSGGGDKTPVGRTVIFDKKYPALYANFMDRLRCSDKVLSEWMQYIFVTFYKNDYSRNYIKQTTGIQNLDLTSMLSNERIPVPNLIEQKSIVTVINEKCLCIDSIIEKTRSSIEEYKKLKQSVITEAVTKGIRPNRNMKDSGIEWIGEIPEDWEVIKHKYVMHKEKEICEHYNGEDIISLTMKGVIIRDLDGGGKMPTTFDGYQYVYPEELLLCLFDIDVTPRCVGVVRNYGLTSPAYSKFVLHDGYITSYYDYLLRAIDDSKVFVHLAKNLRSSLTENDFGSLPTIAPPYKEQIEIVSFLNRKIPEIDSLISKKEQLITELETYKKSLVYEYVTGKKEVKDSISVEYSPEFKKALLMCRILELTQCKGRIHLQKTFFALDTLLNLFSTQYYRFEHGPYDLNIERYEKIIEEKGWLNIYGGKATRYNKTSTFSDYYSEYEKVFKDKDGIIQRICKVFNVPRTTKAEKIATLLAVWNDFLVNGIEPTDDMIIDDVMTNWTPNKANTARETWSEFLSKIRENNIVPKGYGKHTKRMEEMNT